jgi:hypothetical protein
MSFKLYLEPVFLTLSKVKDHSLRWIFSFKFFSGVVVVKWDLKELLNNGDGFLLLNYCHSIKNPLEVLKLLDLFPVFIIECVLLWIFDFEAVADLLLEEEDFCEVAYSESLMHEFKLLVDGSGLYG